MEEEQQKKEETVSAESEEKKHHEEDAEIDLGKITKLFKRKKDKIGETTEKKEPAAFHETEEKEDKKSGEELDIGKLVASVKRGIKGIKAPSAGEDAELQNALKFVSKHYTTLLLVLGMIVSVGIGLDIRMQSGELAFTDGWARNSIETTIQNDISSFVSQQYPNLPERNRQLTVAEELDNARRTGQYTFKTGQYAGLSISIEEQVQGTSDQFKEFFKDAEGRNYMPDIDPYYWVRYARNIIDHGYSGDEIRDGVQWDTYQFAPVGRSIAPQDTFYPKLIVAFHKVAGITGKPLERTFMFLPVFISALTGILVFLITRRIAGGVAAFFAATMASVHPSLLSRTMFGHADSDALIVFLSVFVLWLFIEAFAAGKLKWKLAFGAASGLATGIYSLAWGGWWWIFDFIMVAAAGTIAAFVAYEAFLAARKGNKAAAAIRSAIKLPATRKAFTTLAAYFVSAGLFISLFSGFMTFLTTPLASIGFRTLKTPVVDAASPNVLRTVAELNEGTIGAAIQQMNQGLFVIAALGITALVARAAIEAFKREKDSNKILKDMFYAAVLTIWFAATLYSVTKGVRFTLLLVPAFSIAFGTFAGMVATTIADWVKREFKTYRLAHFAVLAVIFMLMFAVFPGITLSSNTLQTSRNAVRNDVPLINDAWHNALTEIKENSEEGAIITSWWDFGHHFKSIADRPVTFDGTTQLSPQAHWVGRLFSTSSETEAVGILRMLNCGAFEATNTLQERLDDSVKAVHTTKRIIVLDRAEAKSELLKEGLSEEEAEEVLELTHCNPPESFVIASEDMIGKSGVWGHFGAWNYIKADIWKTTRDMDRAEAVEYITSKYGTGREEAESLYSQVQGIKNSDNADDAADAWIGPWYGISGGLHGCGESGENMITCGDGLVVNLTDYDAWYPAQGGNQHPRKIAYPLPDGSIGERRFENNTIAEDVSVMLIPLEGGGYQRLLASTELVDGMFVRMFYLQGHGLKHFKLLTHQTGFTGTNIWVWEADWKGEQENTMQALVPKTEVKTGDRVTLNYIGYLEDGTVFDSSIIDFQSKNVTAQTSLGDNEDYNPLTFTTGRNEVIPGFENRIIGVGIREEKEIAIPPEEGYNVPGHPLYNLTLRFKIKVTEIR